MPCSRKISGYSASGEMAAYVSSEDPRLMYIYIFILYI